ncbi:DNA-binding response regulator [Pseudoscardovia radai]|uniref:DNA-binding response regulator n=1 Tax=Pseudoscardovia radai TaxID=987066 RepID=A0A261EWJ8_9BIFI|nr:response regulator transcription factor [Pseudoscardovia radai]OZG51046.1 DNA-binding response regulator [Pseudoscardovia radai]
MESQGPNADGVITVLVADDQELVRTGFAMVIDSQPDMHVVGLAGDGAEAVRLAADLHPDIVLMDVRMPGMDGIEATRRIVSAPDASSDRMTRVIILTTFDLDDYVMSALLAGASGFLLKDTEPETLLSSIRTVRRGNAIIAPTATKRLIQRMISHDGGAALHVAPTTAPDTPATAQAGASPVSRHASSPHASSPSAPAPQTAASGAAYTDPELDSLTAREREVLVGIARGLSNQEIADELVISLPTVKTHVAHILQKTNSHDRVQAAVFAYQNHLV